MIARGPGASLAGVVCEPRANDPVRDDLVCVQFDSEAGTRYWTSAAGLAHEHEVTPKKPPRPSVRRARKARRA